MTPEPTYTIIVTESERTLMAKAFGGLVTKLINAPIFVESPSGGTAPARSLLSPPAEAPAVAPKPSPVELRDRWARDRKGNEAPNPKGCEALDVRLWKVEQKPPKSAGKAEYWKVTWYAPSGKGYGDANCFDSELAAWVIKASTQVYLPGESVRLYTVRNGEYLNVVGVRA